jgi:uncharacterized membrane protein YbhN (UPF0104 family)
VRLPRLTPRKRLAARIIFFAAVVLVFVVALHSRWRDVQGSLDKLSAFDIVVATIFGFANIFTSMLGWRALLADIGSKLSLPVAMRIFFVGQLGKYLPGSVWTVLVQADMASHLHVPRRRTGVTGLVTIGLSVLTGLLVGLPALPLLLQRSAGSSAWLLLAVPLLVVLVWPALLNRLIAWGLRVLRREPLEETLSTRAILTTVGLYALAWVLFGVHILVLALAVGGGTGVTLASLTGYALAGSLGMLTVILPAGLGARDGILALVLASALPLSAGTAVALVSRFVVTLVDVLAAGAGWAYARRHHLVTSREEREHPVGETVPEEP